MPIKSQRCLPSSSAAADLRRASEKQSNHFAQAKARGRDALIARAYVGCFRIVRETRAIYRMGCCRNQSA